MRPHEQQQLDDSRRPASGGMVYLIDGVRVTARVFFRRLIFGEYAGAGFQEIEKRPMAEAPRYRRR